MAGLPELPPLPPDFYTSGASQASTNIFGGSFASSDANPNNAVSNIGNTSDYNFSTSGLMGTASQMLQSAANAVTGNSSTGSGTSGSSNSITSWLDSMFDLTPTGTIARILFVLLGIVLLGGAIYVYKK